MNIDVKLDEEFSEALNDLVEEYGDELAELNGFGKKQLNYTEFIDNFVDKAVVADASIDGNANVGHKDIVSLEYEMAKPHSKLLAFNKIFYEIRKKYGSDTAREWLRAEWDGHFYLHDAYNSTMKPYCWAADIEDLVNRGLYFIPGFNYQPPKHLVTFTDFISEFISWTCNRSSGAVGIPSFLIYSYWFWKKDVKTGFCQGSPEYYRDQEFQRIIYKLNQPFLRGGIQSAFTNFTIFDREYLVSLFGGREYPDGTFVIDCIDDILEYQKAFMEKLSQIRKENMMTFPVVTFALLRKDGNFVDEGFAKWCCRHNMTWADANFYISEDVTSLSNCCFDGSQRTLSKSSDGVNFMTFRQLYEASYERHKRNFTVFHNGSWARGKVIRVPKKQMYKITTANKKEIIVTEDHLNPTLRGDISTTELSTDDYILFNSAALDSFTEVDDHLTYEQGFLIGMYAGDGSMSFEDDRSTTVVQFSLNKEKYEASIETLKKVSTDIGGVVPKLGKEYNNVYPVTIRSNEVATFIRRYITGKYCFEKSLNMDCLLQSASFRRGILDGYYLTDGGNSNRIYTTSPKMVECMEALITSLGICSVIDVSDRTGEGQVVIRGEMSNRNYPVYCIRWYDPGNRRCLKDVYVKRNNSIFFKITDIEPYESSEEYAYCFEMANPEEPYFTLPNGVITHNCRLVSNIDSLGFFNSIGGTALEVGSVKVNTINLARLAYENDREHYIPALMDQVTLCLKALDRVRHIISRNVEKGLLPNYSLEIVKLSKQYNTIGIIGLYEALQKYGYTKKDQFGYTSYTDEGLAFAKEILQTIHEVKDAFPKEYLVNIEQIPGERAAHILMEKDRIFYPDETYELPLYGNQWIPLGVKTTIQDKVKLSAELDKACSGGSIAHINLDKPFDDFDSAWKILNYVADAGVVYFAFNVRISACENNHGFYGDICPVCGGKKTTTYQRIVGFLTPERTYSRQRKEEFRMRDWFKFSMMEDMS